jgi:large subunit ribosomal protein L19
VRKDRLQEGEKKVDIIRDIDKDNMRLDIVPFNVGDQVKVHVKVVEGNKERIQVYEGAVTRRRKASAGSSFTVRKISYGVGVERIFPLHSPMLSKIEVVRHGKVRRAKLYYLRERAGKAAKIKEKRF